MNLNKSFAVRVRDEEESHAVQEKFFEMGIPWWGTGIGYFDIFRINLKDITIAYMPTNRRRIEYGNTSFYRGKGLKILSADEFLGRLRQAMFIQPRR